MGVDQGLRRQRDERELRRDGVGSPQRLEVPDVAGRQCFREGGGAPVSDAADRSGG